MRGSADGGRASGVDRPGRPARAFVTGFLLLFLVFGFAGVEAWPLGGFRLFSGVREPVQRSWMATAIDRDGLEAPIPFGDLSLAYRGFTHVLRGFEDLSPSRRAGVCSAWWTAVEDRGDRLIQIRVYRTERDLSRRDRDRAAPGTRALAYTCVRTANGFRVTEGETA